MLTIPPATVAGARPVVTVTVSDGDALTTMTAMPRSSRPSRSAPSIRMSGDQTTFVATTTPTSLGVSALT